MGTLPLWLIVGTLKLSQASEGLPPALLGRPQVSFLKHEKGKIMNGAVDIAEWKSPYFLTNEMFNSLEKLHIILSHNGDCSP